MKKYTLLILGMLLCFLQFTYAETSSIKAEEKLENIIGEFVNGLNPNSEKKVQNISDDIIS